MKNPKFLLIDLFCGAGGTTTGAEMSGVCKVVAAVNHDPLAIASHAANHTDVMHLTEDIPLADISPIAKALAYWQAEYPDAKTILWASLECTNFSNAKGGLPRDADSRTLANGLFRYVEALRPDYVLIENVREFMSWGPLDEQGRPVSRYEGRDYLAWVKRMRAQNGGYQFDWRLLTAADFGGVTTRRRYFCAFWRPGLSFAWPQPTHVRRGLQAGSLFDCRMRPWRAVAEVLDFDDLGRSIFDRPKPLVDRTLRRILAGLRKFHAQPTVMTCNTPGYCTSVSDPVGTITTRGHKAIIRPMLQSYYSGGNGITGIDQPAPTCTTKDRFALVTPVHWIDRNFRQGRFQDINEPAGSVLTVPKMNIVTAWLTPSSFDNNPKSIHEPAPTLLASRKHINLTSAFIVNPQYNNAGSPVSAPAPTVIAQQRSKPLALAIPVTGISRWHDHPSDSAVMRELKAFMRTHGIADIYMRMLKEIELKRIQGFPDNYILHGPQNERKKFIGNSVETGVVKAWLRAMATA